MPGERRGQLRGVGAGDDPQALDAAAGDELLDHVELAGQARGSADGEVEGGGQQLEGVGRGERLDRQPRLRPLEQEQRPEWDRPATAPGS